MTFQVTLSPRRLKNAQRAALLSLAIRPKLVTLGTLDGRRLLWTPAGVGHGTKGHLPNTEGAR